MASLQSFLNANRVRFNAEWTDENPHISDMVAGSSHYKCTIKSGSKQLTVYFSQSPAIYREPTAKDILGCLAMDAAGFENSRGFEEWCAEYGYNTGSRKAEKIYHAIEKQTNDLKRVFGVEQYEALLWKTDHE